jgi:hypothetical protein
VIPAIRAWMDNECDLVTDARPRIPRHLASSQDLSEWVCASAEGDPASQNRSRERSHVKITAAIFSGATFRGLSDRIFDIFSAKSGLNVSAGQREARPPAAPTTGLEADAVGGVESMTARG